MRIKDRKPNSRPASVSLQTAITAKAGVRKQTCPKNRVARYFSNWPSTTVAPKTRGADRARELGLRRERARQIMELPLDYVPSPDFYRPNAQQRIAGPMPTTSTTARKPRAPAGLPSYLASLYDTPLLTPEQERHLFRKYNYLKYRAASLRKELNLARPQLRLMDRIERLHHEAVETKNHIIQANLRLVVSIMKRYVTGNSETFELISEGNISLMRAVEKFDYKRGFRFSTYASWAIQKNNARDFANELKRRARFQTSHEEALADCPQPHFDPTQAERRHQERVDRIAKVLARLDKRDRQVIEGRFGLAGNPAEKTLKEVGDELGVSKERIRQLEARAMDRLRELAKEANLGDTLE